MRWLPCRLRSPCTVPSQVTSAFRVTGSVPASQIRSRQSCLSLSITTGTKTAFMNWTGFAPCPSCVNPSSDIRTLRPFGASVSGEQRLTLQSHAISVSLRWCLPNWQAVPPAENIEAIGPNEVLASPSNIADGAILPEEHSPRQHPVVPKWSCRTRQCSVAPKCSMSTRQV